MWFTAFTLWLAVPDATVARPERLLAPTEVALDLGAGAFLSRTTRTPTGGLEPDAFAEGAMRARVQVGLLRFLTASLTVPLGDLLLWQQQRQSLLRYGDPTVGMAIGPALARVHLAAFCELGFASTTRTVLQPVEASSHGVVATTGGVSFVAGAFVYFEHTREGLALRVSARAAYRLRSNEASDGILGDLRLELVLRDHLLLGFNAAALVPLFGLDRALISASRLSDSAGWVDAGARVGWRFTQTIDLSAAFSLPLYTFAGGVGLSLGLLATFWFGPF